MFCFDVEFVGLNNSVVDWFWCCFCFNCYIDCLVTCGFCFCVLFVFWGCYLCCLLKLCLFCLFLLMHYVLIWVLIDCLIVLDLVWVVCFVLYVLDLQWLFVWWVCYFMVVLFRLKIGCFNLLALYWRLRVFALGFGFVFIAFCTLVVLFVSLTLLVAVC